MNARAGAIDCGFQPEALDRGALETPVKRAPMFFDVAQIAKHVLHAPVPKDRLAKDESQRHLVDQGFQRARRRIATIEISMSPTPELAVAIATVVPLNSEAERTAFKASAVQRNLPGEKSIGMRRSRETDPALGTKRHAKRRAISEIPRNRVPIHLQ